MSEGGLDLCQRGEFRPEFRPMLGGFRLMLEGEFRPMLEEQFRPMLEGEFRSCLRGV